MKELFRARMQTMFIMVFAWSMSGPILKTYYGLLNPTILALMSIWVVIIKFAQKPLRKHRALKLLKMSVVMDVIYVLATTAIMLSGAGVKTLLLFDLLYDGPYMVVIYAAESNLENEFFERYTADRRTMVESAVDNTRLKYNIAGLIIGGAIGFIVNDAYLIIALRNALILYGTVKLLTVLPKRG